MVDNVRLHGPRLELLGRARPAGCGDHSRRRRGRGAGATARRERVPTWFSYSVANGATRAGQPLASAGSPNPRALNRCPIPPRLRAIGTPRAGSGGSVAVVRYVLSAAGASILRRAAPRRRAPGGPPEGRSTVLEEHQCARWPPRRAGDRESPPARLHRHHHPGPMHPRRTDRPGAPARGRVPGGEVPRDHPRVADRGRFVQLTDPRPPLLCRRRAGSPSARDGPRMRPFCRGSPAGSPAT